MDDILVLKSSHGNICDQRSMTYYYYEGIKKDIDDDDKP